MEPDREHPLGAELMRHEAWIRRLALALVGDRALADDLVQDTWMAALRRPPATDRPLRPWLGTVLRNAARQAFRGSRRRDERQQAAREPVPVPGPDELAERLETERRMTAALAALGEPYRATLLLRFYEGLEPIEISRRLGVPAGTIRWRLKQGLDELRERLDERFGSRAQWSALVLSLARPTPAVSAPAVPPSVALTGALTMHALTKLSIGAATVAVLALGLRLAGALPDALWPFASEARVDLARRPYAAPAEVVEASTHRAAVSGDREALAVAAPVVSPPHAAEDVVGPVGDLVHARAVDELGAAVRTARLRWLDGEVRVAHADREGNLALELPGTRPGEVARLELSAPGFASVGLEPVVLHGAPTHLGAIVLPPGAAISGTVGTRDGRFPEGVHVGLIAASTPRRDVERLRLHPPRDSVPTTRTRAGGQFFLEGAPPGPMRVWAHAEGYLAAFSATIDLVAGQESYGLDLVLEPIPETNRVTGIVLDPGDAAVPGARIEYRHASRSTGSTTSGEEVADESGRFEFLLPPDAELWLTAHDPHDRLAPASVSAVRTGSGEVVLRLAAAEPFALRVVDEAGRPVERYAAALRSPDGELTHASADLGPHEDGRASLRRPSVLFEVRVVAPGFDVARVGPLDPRRVEQPLVVVLAPVPGLTGHVWLGDVPAVGVEVELAPLHPPGTHVERDGFATLLGESIDRTVTEGDGSFLLTPREAGRYVVRAERAGLAPAVSAPIELGPSLSSAPVQLELSPGGSIEGHVIRLDGADPSGTIVGLSRGDGHDRTVRVGPDGAYRFEHLVPGPWLLVERAEEIRPGTTTVSSRTGGRTREIPFNCEVHEGHTTQHDLRIGERAACVLGGRLTIDGRGAQGWNAGLVDPDLFFADEAGASVALGEDGGFVVTASEPGRRRLVLSNGEEDSAQFFLDLVDLRLGDQSWQHDLATGALEVEGVPAWDGGGAPPLVHLWSDVAGKTVVTVVSGDAQGVARCPAVPAGAGRLVRPANGSFEIESWPTVVEVEVPRGGTARASLP